MEPILANNGQGAYTTALLLGDRYKLHVVAHCINGFKGEAETGESLSTEAISQFRN